MPSRLEAALAANRRRDWPKAVVLWQRLRMEEPDCIQGYTRAALVHVALRDFGEAESLLQAALERDPDHREAGVMWARLAQQRKDFAAAAERWASLRARHPNTARAYAGGAEALCVLGRLDEAWALLQQAKSRFSANCDVALALARTAEARRDWQEAELHWQAMRVAFPENLLGHAGYLRLMLERGKLDRARAALPEVPRRFSAELQMRLFQARIATGLQNWNEAREIWGALHKSYPANVEITAGLAETCALAGDMATADAMMAHADKRFGLTPELARARARIEASRDAQREAPRPQARNGATIVALAPVARMDAAEEPADMPLSAEARRRFATLLADFQSLGDGSLFASLQKEFGLQPNGLLCWATLPIHGLIAALHHCFAGVGEKMLTGLDRENGEYIVCDTRFHLRIRSFVSTESVQPDLVFPKLCRTVTAARRKLLLDLAVSNRIFVHRSQSAIDDETALILGRELKAHGARHVLVVQPSSARYPEFTLRAVGPRVLVGYMRPSACGLLRVGTWKRLCEDAHAHWHGRPDMSLRVAAH